MSNTLSNYLPAIHVICRGSQLVLLLFEVFRISRFFLKFLIFEFTKYFWLLLSFPKLNFQRFFCKSSVKRSLIQTRTLCKLAFIFYFFLKNSRISFHCLGQEIWLGDLWKTICIYQLRFPKRWRIKKCLTYLKIF